MKPKFPRSHKASTWATVLEFAPRTRRQAKRRTSKAARRQGKANARMP